MPQFTICTIIAKNYLAHARCLTESFLEHHPDGQVIVLLADRNENHFDPGQERFVTVEAQDLGISDFEQMAFRYNVTEFSTGVKPFFLAYLFEQLGLTHLCYFDPDIYFYQPLTHLQRLLDTQSIVLTPHLLDFIEDQYLPDELYILRAGVYNLGFIGLARSAATNKLLRWWQQRLRRDCVIDTARGLFVDQRWIDLIPGVFDEVGIVRDPGYNAAYWNLSHRRLNYADQQWTVNDGPLTFYHFSGLVMNDLNAISKYQNRYTLRDRPELVPLFTGYENRLLANGYETVKHWPYAYQCFDNGVVIPEEARHLWRNLEGETRWPHPFQTGVPDEFLAWLNQDVQANVAKPSGLSNLAVEIYRQRWDLQQQFPDVLGAHRTAFVRWFVRAAEIHATLAPEFVEPVQKYLNNQIDSGLGPARTSETRAASDLPWRQRLYYLVRNPLRRLGLHEWFKQLLGPKLAADVWMYAHAGQPSTQVAMTRSRINPVPQTHFSVATVENSAVTPPPPAWEGGLNVVGYLRAETGVGEVSRAVIRALQATNYPVARLDLTNPDWARAEDYSVLHVLEGTPHAFNLLCVNADMVPEVARQLGSALFAGRYTIGFWHWETANFPAQWLDRFAYFDEIWVDSSFTQKALALVSPIPVVNVQLPVNSLQPSGLQRSDLTLPEDRFLFLFSFDMHSFIQRKNPYGLIEAYKRAFAPNFGNTQLVIKVNNLGGFSEEAARLRSELDRVEGRLIDRYMDRRHLTGLFEVCDAYISLHRSEGFGLTLAEAMALSKPVIGTAYSGNMDFMTPSNSYLVGYRVSAIDQDYGPYRCGDEWAEPDLDHAAELMRLVVAKPKEAITKGIRAAEDMQRWYSSEIVSQRMVTRLERLSSDLNDDRVQVKKKSIDR